MRIRTFIGLSLAAAGLVGVAAGAQSIDKRTFFEFTGPVAVPGVTLPAGKYMFRVAPTTQRDVLQVLSADGTKSYAQFFALRARRAESIPTPEVRFMETGPGVPAAIKTWWYPSDRIGYEFIYPTAQARLLAAGTGQPVLTTRNEELTLVEPSGAERETTTPTPFTLTLPALIGELAPDSIPAAEPTQQARAALPRTAGEAPRIMLFGVLLLFATGLLAAARVARR